MRDARRFYEIEAEADRWSVRKLERLVGSSLYERLVLSRETGEIRHLSREGLVIQQAADVIKNPLVLGFLDLQEHYNYSEADLESAIIDKLQQFLL